MWVFSRHGGSCREKTLLDAIIMESAGPTYCHPNKCQLQTPWQKTLMEENKKISNVAVSAQSI